MLDSEDSRAVLIGLDPGQELGEHQVRERAWVVVLGGEVEVQTTDDTISAPAGTLLCGAAVVPAQAGPPAPADRVSYAAPPAGASAGPASGL